MAEYVEQRMEEMMNEVEQMERVNLLQAEEVRELVRRRKQYEYKLQKRNKAKEDFLEYIQYEANLLRLLEMRRETTGYHHKQAEIEGSIKTRINKLFKILEHRNQSDVTVWRSHIQFLKTCDWEEAVSRLYLRMLQVHSDKPGLWVEAAGWEFEEVGSAENARKILLRGLRFLPKSWVLQREYVKMELLYVEQLRKRKQVLGGNNEEAKEDEEKDENEDNVLDCSIVKLVVNNAVETINDPKFVVSLIATIRKFPFAENVALQLFECLEEKFHASPITWDTLAREKLKDGIVPCVEKYFEGLELIKSKELFELAFSTLTELPSIFPKSMVRITKNLLKLLEFGKEHGLLAVGHYKLWLELLDDEAQDVQKTGLLGLALDQHPASVPLWTAQLSFTHRTGAPGTKALGKQFAAALEAVRGDAEAAVEVWEVMLGLVEAERGWAMLHGEDSLLDTANPRLRLLHLDRASYRDLAAAREVWARYRDQPPYSAALGWRMLELEQEAGDTHRARLVLAWLCQHSGSEDPRTWLQAAALETRAGKPLEAAQLLARAEASLKPELREKFAVLRDNAGL